ncbi:hypothetical protein [Paraburkholderia sp. J8-2]|uniref:hypothetical protein n=1 Tax=Paraburkholderia sp. J8-2 TaxID=2805440 RepID=UPI002AB76918|nr:hypothetical protein [Paraburkholderia sp. J8-2]
MVIEGNENKKAGRRPAAFVAALAIAGVVGVGDLAYQLATTRNEIESARSQCSALFQNAAKQIDDKDDVALSVGPVNVERFKDRENGPDFMDCSANVAIGHGNQADRWMAEVRPGKSLTLQSARLAGTEMVDDLHLN